jgi:hypothetical protein
MDATAFSPCRLFYAHIYVPLKAHASSLMALRDILPPLPLLSVRARTMPHRFDVCAVLRHYCPLAAERMRRVMRHSYDSSSSEAPFSWLPADLFIFATSSACRSRHYFFHTEHHRCHDIAAQKSAQECAEERVRARSGAQKDCA